MMHNFLNYIVKLLDNVLMNEHFKKNVCLVYAITSVNEHYAKSIAFLIIQYQIDAFKYRYC